MKFLRGFEINFSRDCLIVLGKKFLVGTADVNQPVAIRIPKKDFFCNLPGLFGVKFCICANLLLIFLAWLSPFLLLFSKPTFNDNISYHQGRGEEISVISSLKIYEIVLVKQDLFMDTRASRSYL